MGYDFLCRLCNYWFADHDAFVDHFPCPATQGAEQVMSDAFQPNEPPEDDYLEPEGVVQFWAWVGQQEQARRFVIEHLLPQLQEFADPEVPRHGDAIQVSIPWNLVDNLFLPPPTPKREDTQQPFHSDDCRSVLYPGEPCDCLAE